MVSGRRQGHSSKRSKLSQKVVSIVEERSEFRESRLAILHNVTSAVLALLLFFWDPFWLNRQSGCIPRPNLSLKQSKRFSDSKSPVCAPRSVVAVQRW